MRGPKEDREPVQARLGSYMIELTGAGRRLDRYEEEVVGRMVQRYLDRQD